MTETNYKDCNGEYMGYNNLRWCVKVFEDNDWEVVQDE